MGRSARAQAVLRWVYWTLVMAICMVTLRWVADAVQLPHGIIRGVVIGGISGAVASVCFPQAGRPRKTH